MLSRGLSRSRAKAILSRWLDRGSAFPIWKRLASHQKPSRASHSRAVATLTQSMAFETYAVNFALCFEFFMSMTFRHKSGYKQSKYEMEIAGAYLIITVHRARSPAHRGCVPHLHGALRRATASDPRAHGVCVAAPVSNLTKIGTATEIHSTQPLKS